MPPAIALQHVVEIVRDAARELAHRLHLLRLPQRRLGALALRRFGLKAVEGMAQLGRALRDLRLELFAAAGQKLARPHLVVDVGRGSEPLDRAAIGVTDGRGATLEPAPCAVRGLVRSVLDSEVAAPLRLGPGGHRSRPVVGVDGVEPAKATLSASDCPV